MSSWLDIEAEPAWDLVLVWDGAMRGRREFLVGETARLRAVARDQRTGVILSVDAVNLVWLRNAAGEDVFVDQTFTETDTGSGYWTFVTQPLDPGRYEMLVESTSGTTVVRGTDSLVVRDP